MEFCEDGHDQVCFDCRKCPLCEELNNVSKLEDKIYDLEEEIDTLKDKIAKKEN